MSRVLIYFTACYINNSADDVVETNFECKKPSCVKDVRYEEACNRLAVEAVKRGCTDNVTIMIVDISPRDIARDDSVPGQAEK